nr:hypothetical protein [Nakamurella flavida]
MIGHPEIAVLLAVGSGFALGQVRVRSVSLGAVTGTLLVGVALGVVVRLPDTGAGRTTLVVDGPARNIFFLLFLFALGVRLGPQFVAGLRGTGAPQALFAVVLAVVGFATVLGVAAAFGLNPGLAAGVAGGALTQSAIVGVAQGSIAGLGADASTLQEWSDLVPVAYAVTYLFGTVGTALYCANIAPRLLGITALPAAAAALEERLGLAGSAPDVHSAYLDVTRRAYLLTALPDGVRTCGDLETYLETRAGGGQRVYVARVRTGDTVRDADPGTVLAAGGTVALTARRMDLFADALAPVAHETDDRRLLDFGIEDLWVMVSHRGAAGRTVGELRTDGRFRRIYVRALRRGGHDVPLADPVTLHAGDEVRVQGPQPLLEQTIPSIGHAERSDDRSGMVAIGLGIAAGALVGVPALHAGGIPVGLSTSVGALLAGLLLGWFRTRRPITARIPAATDWFLESAGLAFFIAMVGISAGPSFLSGLTRYGVGILLAGVVVTLVPLLVMTALSRWVFRFDPVLTLGMLAGARSSSAAAGAVRDAARSSAPMLGYTVPYAVANVALTIGGAVVVALTG